MKLVLRLKIAVAGIAALSAATSASCAPNAPVSVSPVQVETLPPNQTSSTCAAQDLQSLVGQHRRVLETMRFAGPVRFIEPGMMVTLDYSPSRLNIHIDAAGVIRRVVCG